MVWSDKILLTMTPVTMLALLACYGFDAASTLLNGLAIGFMLEMDNVAFSAVLNHHSSEVVVEQARSIITEHPRLGGFHAFCKRRGMVRGCCCFLYLICTFEVMKEVSCGDLLWLSIICALFLLAVGAILEELVAPDMHISQQKKEDVGAQEGEKAEETAKRRKFLLDMGDGSSSRADTDDLRNRGRDCALRAWHTAVAASARWAHVLIEIAAGAYLVFFSISSFQILFYVK